MNEDVDQCMQEQCPTEDCAGSRYEHGCSDCTTGEDSTVLKELLKLGPPSQ